MKTTLNIADSVMRELKREAARQGRTMSELVKSALRRLLRHGERRPDLPALPELKSGGHRVDVANREVLYQVLAEIPHLAGNLFHDARTAILMREHGVRTIYTRDTDFHRFPFLQPVDPVA